MNEKVYEKIKKMSIEELADWLYANCEWLSADMVLVRVQRIICIYLNFSIVMENIKAVIKWRT